MYKNLRLIIAFLIHQFFLVDLAHGHGRLLEPPARNTLWRFGFKAPANYNDNELFCGGIGGITRNEGKCGVCGDSYDGLRIHETGQSMALNVTTRNYFPGSSMDLMIEIVANHGGKFKFEMCWRDDWNVIEAEDCFEELRLTGAKAEDDEDQQYSYYLDPARGTGIYTMSVDLPLNRTCENCIFRWHWRSANNWGTCEDGSEAVGCGYQEVYRNCADISVKRDGAGIGLQLHRRKRSTRWRSSEMVMKMLYYASNDVNYCLIQAFSYCAHIAAGGNVKRALRSQRRPNYFISQI